MEADKKIFCHLLKGINEFNEIQRIIDYNILVEACHFDFKKLAEIIKKYYENYRVPPTYTILREYLADDFDTLELVTAIEYETCESNEIKFYIDIIRKRYNAYLAKVLSESVSKEDFEPEEYNKTLGRIQAKIDRLYKSAVFAEGDLQQSVEDRKGRYLYTEEHPNEISGVFTGYKDLDEYTFGIKKQEMMVIAGASSSGKSLLMMNIAINAWLGHSNPLKMINDPYGKNVLFFSLEMSKPQLENRTDANIANISLNRIIRGKLLSDEKSKYFKALDFCKQYDKRFYICDMPRGSRTLDIEARFDAICAEFEPDLVCVDYLGIMSPNTNNKQDWLDVGHVAADLHEFCRSKNIPLITAAQRKAKDKKAKTQFNDTEEVGRSKMIGDNCNIMLLIENRDEELLRSDMVTHLTKNRDGAKGKITFLKNFENARIESLPDNWIGESGDENEVG